MDDQIWEEDDSTPDGSDPGGGEVSPRHVQVRKALEERLAAGAYPAGSLLPTELQLASEFGASRFTIRTALRHLTERGFLERRQGVGTRVLTTEPGTRYSQSFASIDAIFEVTRTTWYVLHSMGAATLDEAVADRIGAQPGGVWQRIVGVRWTEPGGRPLCYIESFVPPQYAAAVPDLDAEKGPFFAQLERHAEGPIDEVVQEIRAGRMPAEASRLLGQRPQAWGLQILRRYMTIGGVLIASFNWHPGDQLTYTMRITRERRNGDTA